MTKSDLKQLIKESIMEIISEVQYKISPKEKNLISKELHKPETHAVLGGTKKIESVGRAITIITNALQNVGFHLNMVTGDILLGDKGSRLLSYTKKSTNPDPFIEGPEVVNSRISITWEKMSNGFEIIAYVT